MSFAASIASDYLGFDGRETVTYSSVTSSGQTDYTSINALRRMETNQEQSPSFGAYTSGRLDWSIPDALLTPTPKPRDIITDSSGAEYTVIGVDYSTLMLRWHLRTINLAIAADLKDRLTYYAPKNEINSAGKRVAYYSPRYRNIACRFQPLDTNPKQYQGRRLNLTTYEVYCAREMEITIEGYVKDQNGNQYQIESWRGVERLEDLFTIVVSL